MYTLQYNGQIHAPRTLDQIKTQLAQGLIPSGALYLDAEGATDGPRENWKPLSELLPASAAQPPALPAAAQTSPRPRPIVGIIVLLLLGVLMVMAALGNMNENSRPDPALSWLPGEMSDSFPFNTLPFALEIVSGSLLAIGALLAIRNPSGPRLVRVTSRYMLIILAVAAIIPLITLTATQAFSSILGDSLGAFAARMIPFILGLCHFREKVYG
jgi:hypothetical protein